MARNALEELVEAADVLLCELDFNGYASLPRQDGRSRLRARADAARAFLVAQKVGHCEGCRQGGGYCVEVGHDCVVGPTPCTPCPGLSIAGQAEPSTYRSFPTPDELPKEPERPSREALMELWQAAKGMEVPITDTSATRWADAFARCERETREAEGGE